MHAHFTSRATEILYEIDPYISKELLTPKRQAGLKERDHPENATNY